VLLPSFVDTSTGDLYISLPIISSPLAVISKTDPIFLTFRVESVREVIFMHATVTVSGDTIIQRIVAEMLPDATDKTHLIVRAIRHSVEAI
jgi:hypothetical protein